MKRSGIRDYAADSFESDARPSRHPALLSRIPLALHPGYRSSSFAFANCAARKCRF